jgi:hypothetical protein
MLEGDKNRSGLKQLIEQAMSNQNISGYDQGKFMWVKKRLYFSGPSRLIIPAGQRLTYQRSAKGNVIIQVGL